MKIERMLTTLEFSESDHENLVIVIKMLSALIKNLQENGEESIQSTVDGKCIKVDELQNIIYCLNVLANARKFIVD